MGMSPEGPAIEAHGLSKSFKPGSTREPGRPPPPGGRSRRSREEIVAVKALDLRVEPGEVFGFLGPNGAGKTTTIRMLGAMLTPTAGSARVAGFDIVKQRLDVRRHIGFMSDTPLLYPQLKGREFLEFMAELWGHDLISVQPRLEKLLAMFDLADRAEDLTQDYSLGMRRKLYLAGILIHDPQILFLDEPTSGMDARSAKLVKQLLRALAERGKTVFLSTHMLEMAQSICTRIAIINKGEVVAVGTMEELTAKAERGSGSLEDIFLKLTGEPDLEEVAEFLT